MKKKILCLVLTLVLTAGAATTAFAKDYQGADGWNVTFDGSKMNSNFQDSDVMMRWQIFSRVTASN